ncbi:hypothetical protein [Streptomyces pratensis]|uniref:hypothetical protein n=1 Tax=Streptomyces pratensis TaxID=1169025 RepID=UPI0019346B0F|nr:hypothetical protein [Streptomyces pratensis]
MFPENTGHLPAEQAVTIHQPAPLAPYPAAPLAPMQPHAVPSVTSIVLPDGRVITGYAIDHNRPEPVTAKPLVSRAAVNIAIGGIGFAAVCGGLVLLTTFIAALAALVQQLIILAAVIFGGFIALQVLTAGRERGTTTVNIRKAVIKRNHFHG